MGLPLSDCSLVRLVLDHIPVLNQKSVLDCHDVCRNPACRQSYSGEAPMGDDCIAISHNDLS